MGLFVCLFNLLDVCQLSRLSLRIFCWFLENSLQSPLQMIPHTVFYFPFFCDSSCTYNRLLLCFYHTLCLLCFCLFGFFCFVLFLVLPGLTMLLPGYTVNNSDSPVVRLIPLTDFSVLEFPFACF